MRRAKSGMYVAIRRDCYYVVELKLVLEVGTNTNTNTYCGYFSTLKMLSLLLLLLLVVVNPIVFAADSYSRADFPAAPDFVFGSGTSAYQVEGAADQDGRTPSIWDTFVHDGYMGGANGDVACDGYHKYKEDVKLMVETGLEAYRFSISWSRLIPNGRGPINQKGLQFYNNFINQLLIHGIEPHVTLHHNDLPQCLEDEYGGWVDRKIVKDFTSYAEVCFREFGDRVSHWTTVNEANIFVLSGYDQGMLAPMRCSAPFGKITNCSRGDSTIEPYLAAHNMLLAHASVTTLYRTKYWKSQRGFVGINLLAIWFTPLTDSREDEMAVRRVNDFFIGWFVHPLVFGDYPETVKKTAGSRIPRFSDAERELVKGSFDFVGINFYLVMYVKDNPSSLEMEPRDVFADMGAQLIYSLPQDNAYKTWGTSRALQAMLEYFKHVYGNPPIYVQENGQGAPRNSTLEDWPRVKSLSGFIGGLLDALRNGSNTRGYFTWSFLDVFELLDGYKSGFGLYYVDLDDPCLTRQPKLSAHWYSDFFKGKNITSHEIIQLQTNSQMHHNSSRQLSL